MDELKSFSQIPRITQQPLKPIPNRDNVRLYQPRPKEPVVDGDINWKPIDQVAARVVAAAPWYCQPPESEPQKAKPVKPQDFPQPSRLREKRKLTEDGYVENHINQDDLSVAALDQHEHTVRQGIKGAEELIERSQDVVAAIHYLAQQIQEPWAEYQNLIKQAIADTREQRIALGSETRLLMQSLKEVRQFFIDKDHEAEVNRLHEFIDVCERLKALQDSGFLNAIADTILKL